ncbi:Predicted arabinose efflux permease, MFS family [Nitrosospira multiformis]|uniref:Predicted arabinose efflux permease, MFS family n=1 Tax=Nitrosospira multiformis TaxID=1231 RepID=A0A1H8PVG4_9PROT|nr:MFS transporter [Nitrosospira multiformis]SEO45657.1 Predicted arabinose efflux permease, MFS family [Nitrosospira multiformis]
MRNLTVLLVCQAVTTLGLMVFVPIMPLYIATLEQMDGSSAGHWSSLALSAPALGTLCFAPYVGKWCDRFGYKQMLLISLCVFIASMLLMALGSTVYGFMLGRLLQGVSTIGVVLTAFIGYISDDTSRGRSLGLQESAIASGALAGPVLGGIMLDYWSLKPLLLTSAMLTGVAGGILWSKLSEPRKAVPISGLSFFGLRTVLSDSNLRNWMLAACLIQAAAFAFVNVFALYLSARFPSGEAIASKVGLLHALGWLATMLAAPLWGHLNDRGEPRRYFIIAAMGCALSTGLLVVIDEIWLIALLRLGQGACYAALMQSVLLACSRQLPASEYGHVTGLSRSFMVVGQLAGPLLIMLLLPVFSPISLVWPVAVLFFIGGLLVLYNRTACFSFAEIRK